MVFSTMNRPITVVFLCPYFSNGVGKSTLAMASLWALVGSIDPRPTQDGKVGDVVNDHSKVSPTVLSSLLPSSSLTIFDSSACSLQFAEVTLRGSLNSKPFLVKRTKSISSGSLAFVLDGVDLTRQSAKDTQTLINAHFGAEPQVLTRIIFHGQHSIGGLLESSDAKLKDELSFLVPLDVWQQSASLARSKQRELVRRQSDYRTVLHRIFTDVAFTDHGPTPTFSYPRREKLPRSKA